VPPTGGAHTYGCGSHAHASCRRGVRGPPREENAPPWSSGWITGGERHGLVPNPPRLFHQKPIGRVLAPSPTYPPSSTSKLPSRTQICQQSPDFRPPMPWPTMEASWEGEDIGMAMGGKPGGGFQHSSPTPPPAAGLRIPQTCHSRRPATRAGTGTHRVTHHPPDNRNTSNIQT
jgi:hypothetical protein